MRLANGAVLTANYAVASENQLLYFPPIFLNSADLDSQAFVRPDGFVREPVANSTLVLRFYEPLKDIDWRADYLNTLRNHPEVTNELRALQKVIPSSMLETRRVALECHVGGITNTLLEADLPDRDNELETRVSFRIPPDCVPFFRNLRAEDLDVVVRQLYRARFQTNDVLITFNSLRTQFGKLQLGLVPAPDNSPAGLLLDATLPVGLVQSGNLTRSERLSEFLSTSVRLELLVRAGSTVDESLLGALFDHVLSEADWISKSANDNSNTVVTLLLSDRLQITGALGVLSRLSTERTVEVEQKLLTAITDSLQDNGEFKLVNGLLDAAISVGFPELKGLGTLANELSGKWDNQESRQQQFENFFKGMTNVQAWVEGRIPYLPGIRFGDEREGENIHWTETEGVIGQFTIGSAGLARRQSFRPLASRAEAQSLLDLLLVNHVQVGEKILEGQGPNTPIQTDWSQGVITNAPAWAWKRFRSKVFDIQFASPFAAKPSVVASVSAYRNWVGDVDNFSVSEIAVRVEDVTTNGFRLRFVTESGPDGAEGLTYAGATWIASGRVRLREALAGQTAAMRLPGLLGVTTNEFGSAGFLQPQLQPLQMHADGSFSLNFDTLPGREYRVDASTNLQSWWPYHSFVATDFKATFATNRPAGLDRLFLRVTKE